MRADTGLIFDEALVASVIATFEQYGVAVTASARSRAVRVRTHDAVGVIGFTGDCLRGTLVLATTTALVRAANPVHQGDHGPDAVRDWVGELSNLVLGKIKVALARRGVTLGLATPVAFTGERLRMGPVQASRTRSWDFASPAGDIRVWLEADCAADFELPEASPEDDLAAGEPLLF